MTDDIVTRLQHWGGDPSNWDSEPERRIADGTPQEMLWEAANEIDRLRFFGDRLFMHLDSLYGATSVCPFWVQRDLDSWKEFRRD